jgi:hypothetical protein
MQCAAVINRFPVWLSITLAVQVCFTLPGGKSTPTVRVP